MKKTMLKIDKHYDAAVGHEEGSVGNYVDTSVFTEKDYDEIVNSGYMFFRKVVSGVSDSLMDKVDKYRALNENL